MEIQEKFNFNDVLNFISRLHEAKCESEIRLAARDHEKPRHSSHDLNELFAALAKAQGDMGSAGLNSENPYFKSSYADLAEIVRVSRPSLSKNGLCVTQRILTDDSGATTLHTVMAHSSG